MSDESRSPDGDGHREGLVTAVGDSVDSGAATLPPQQGHVHARDGNRSEGVTPALTDERLAGSEPADSHLRGKSVSTEFTPVPTDTPDGGLIVRAWIECPECIERRATSAEIAEIVKLKRLIAEQHEASLVAARDLHRLHVENDVLRAQLATTR